MFISKISSNVIIVGPLCIVFSVMTAHWTHGQSTSKRAEVATDDAKEKLAAERFEKMLLAKPQLGTALDRFYEFHRSRGTLDSVIQRLRENADAKRDANAYQLLGLLAVQRGEHAKAVDAFRKATELAATDSNAWLHLARALVAGQQFDEALAALKNAVDQNPAQPVALELVKLLSQVVERSTDRELANSIASELATKYQSNVPVSEQLAEVFVALERPESAMPLFDSLIAQTRDAQKKLELRLKRARLYEQLGHADKSLSEMEAMLPLVRPQSWLSSNLVEEVDRLANELYGAEGLAKYYEQRLEKDVGNVELMLRLAKVFQELQNEQESEKWIQKACTSAPSDAAPWIALAELQERSGVFAEALKNYERALQLAPENADVVLRAAQCALQTDAPEGERKSKAVVLWRRLLTGREGDPARLRQVAKLHEEASLNEEAIALYRELVKVAPDSQSYRLLGECLTKVGRPEDATREFRLAIDTAESTSELIELIRLMERSGQNELAQSAASKARKLKGTWQEQLQLAELLASQGNSNESMAMLREAASSASNSLAWSQIWDAQLRLLTSQPMLAESSRGEQSTVGNEEAVLVAVASGQMSTASGMARQIAEKDEMSPRGWAFAAWVDQRAKRTLQEIESLQRLAVVDADRRLSYLERIAALQFQTSQVDAAKATLKQMLELPDVGVRQYQLAWSFQLQAKDEDSAVQTMRTASQRFPRERAAWVALAQHLANPSEAIEAAWQGLIASTEESLQRESLKSLVDLYRRRSDVTELLRRLASMADGKRQPKQSVDRWIAWVLSEVPKTDVAEEFAARLLNATSDDPLVVQAAVKIAVDRMKWQDALRLQKRLLRNKVDVKERLRLVELYVLADDVEGARRDWAKMLAEKTYTSNVIEFVQDLANRQQWKVITALVSADIDSDEWELLAYGMHAHWMGANEEQAVALADSILAMNLAIDSTLVDADSARSGNVSSADRLEWLEHAGGWQELLNESSVTRAGYRVDPSNPRAAQAALVRKLALERGATLKSTRTEQLRFRGYGDARALAVLMKFGKAARMRGGESEWSEYVEKAIHNRDTALLWDCVLVLAPAQSKSTELNRDFAGANDGTGELKSRYSEILQLLVEADEPDALGLAIHDIVAAYQLRHQMAARLNQTTPPLPIAVLSRLRDYIQRAGERKQDASFLADFVLLVESERARGEAFDWSGLDEVLSRQADPARVANCISQFVLNESFLREAAERGLLRLFELEMRSLDSTMLPVTVELAGRWAEYADKQSLIQMLDETIARQAALWSSLNGEKQFVDAHLIPPAYNFRTVEDRKRVALRPDRSSAMSASLQLILDLCFSRLSDDEILKASAGADSDLKKTEYGLRLYAVSVRQAARGESAAAIDSVSKAEEQVVSTELLRLYRAKLLTVNQLFEEAKELLDSIEPRNEYLLRAIEVCKFEIAKQSNDTQELARCANVLSKMPLSVRELAEVAAAQTSAKP